MDIFEKPKNQFLVKRPSILVYDSLKLDSFDADIFFSIKICKKLLEIINFYLLKIIRDCTDGILWSQATIFKS